jgi:hypothetical protein
MTSLILIKGVIERGAPLVGLEEDKNSSHAS